MKNVHAILCCALLALPAMSMADDDRFQHGVSGSVIDQRADTETEKALKEQSESGGAEQSEISTTNYVDSQRRHSDTFKQPIPERIGERTRDDQ